MSLDFLSFTRRHPVGRVVGKNGTGNEVYLVLDGSRRGKAMWDLLWKDMMGGLKERGE